MELIKYSWNIYDHGHPIRSFNPFNPYLYQLMNGEIIDIRLRRYGCFGTPIYIFDPFFEVQTIEDHIEFISKEFIRVNRNFKLDQLGI
jgi:hypothetical protein